VVITPVVGIPVACVVAVLKYRLYDLGRIVSRTVSYAIVTGLLVGVYAGLVLLATGLTGRTSPVAVAGARWPRRPCSGRSGPGSSGGWITGSTGPGMTPNGCWPRSRLVSPKSWTPTR
jgi:hypothetical protein